MRLCNALIQYILFISLSLIVYHCHGHEHHSHVDPVTSKFAESAVPVDPLTKPLETANIRENHDDGHQHDTIEARLQAKHNLRQSVHQHIDDDKHENEEDYINRLNSALEDDYKTEHHFQYVAPPIADTVNNATAQNQTEEDIQIPIHTQTETISSTPTSIQTSQEHEKPTNERLPSADGKDNSKVVVQETVSPIQTQNIVKEDILFVHKETITSTKSESQEEKLVVNNNPSLSDDQPTVNDTLQNQTSSDSKPLQTDQTQQAAFDSVQNISSSDFKSTQSNVVSDTLQNIDPIDVKLNQQEAEVEVTSVTPPINLSSERLKASDTKIDQEQPSIETIQVNRSSDVDVNPLKATDSTTSSPTPIKTEQRQQQQTVDTIKPIETPPTDAKSDDVPSSVTEGTPTLAETPAPAAKILRSATSRMQHRAQVRQRQLREQESEKHSHTDHSTVETPVPTSTLPTVQQPVDDHYNHSVSSDDHESSIDSTSTLQQKEPIVETPQTPTLQSQEFTVESTTTPLSELNEPTVEVPQVSTSQAEELTLENTQTPLVQVQEPFVETAQTSTIDVDLTNDTDTSSNNQDVKTVDPKDLPRQVHVHGSREFQNELNENIDTPSLDQQVENSTTVDSFLTNDHTRHLPRTLENEEILSTPDPTILTLTNTARTVETTPETNLHTHPTDFKTEEITTPLPYKTNITDQLLSTKNRQVCWSLAKPLDSSVQLIEKQTLRFVNLLPEFLQTTLFGHQDDRETMMNTIWSSSIATLCFFFSIIFLSLGAKRLKQTKHEKEIRARCQQLQQYNNQLELERATFERENQKLYDEIEELKNQPVRDTDEEIFQLRENYEHLHAEWKNLRVEYDNLQRDNEYKQSLMQKHNLDIQKQVETVAYLNDEILRQKQELEKERETIARLQSNDLSLERFEQLKQIIHELKSEITQLKQDKFAQTDELQQVQERANQLEIDNNELTIKMKQLKDLLEQRDQTITRFKEKFNNNNNDHDEEENEDDDDQQISETNAERDEQQRELLSTIDNDVEKANQHMRNLHLEIEEKTRRLKELDNLLNQEKDRCRELETKLKVVLELRERDAHLHIRQLGQTDSELRKARTDTERVRILQQQLELKQQQLDDVQKVLASEQTKFSEECSKLQHETHEKWMEVKRLTRELDGAKKECEGLRRQITKYAQNDRSSQEKTMRKPIPQHLNNTGRLSSEPEINGSSPPPLPYQQGDNFRPIDHERNDSGAASPSDMMRIRPPLFGLARPPFFPPPFMPPPPNPFLMAQRFPMPPGGPHGMISPIPHLMTNGSAGGSDSNSFEIVDSTNITPNSTSYDAQANGSALSPTPDDEQPTTTKPKKPKKSLKKKTKTSATTTVSGTKEDV